MIVLLAGHYWAIHPANVEDFQKGDFRRRKAQRKVRKHMGLAVDEEDSPTPPASPVQVAALPWVTSEALHPLQHHAQHHAQHSAQHQHAHHGQPHHAQHHAHHHLLMMTSPSALTAEYPSPPSSNQPSNHSRKRLFDVASLLGVVEERRSSDAPGTGESDGEPEAQRPDSANSTDALTKRVKIELLDDEDVDVVSEDSEEEPVAAAATTQTPVMSATSSTSAAAPAASTAGAIWMRTAMLQHPAATAFRQQTPSQTPTQTPSQTQPQTQTHSSALHHGAAPRNSFSQHQPYLNAAHLPFQLAVNEQFMTKYYEQVAQVMRLGNQQAPKP